MIRHMRENYMHGVDDWDSLWTQVYQLPALSLDEQLAKFEHVAVLSGGRGKTYLLNTVLNAA